MALNPKYNQAEVTIENISGDSLKQNKVHGSVPILSADDVADLIKDTIMLWGS